MKRGFLVVLLVLIAGGLGIALAAGVGALSWRSAGRVTSPGFGPGGWGMMPWGNAPRSGWRGWGMGPGMMGGWNRPANPASGKRLTIDQAEQAALGYIQNDQASLQIAEVMEFEENFYAIVKEAATGKGAFEILIDPYSGEVVPEPGPNMMWNLKYGHMSRGQGDSDLTLEQANKLAQAFLEKNVPGASVEGSGTAFYGYFTFDYQVNGAIAGMLSINGFTGAAWLHTWHGGFISEKEFEK